MNPRLRRLQADYDHVAAAFTHHPHIRLLGAEGSPPEKYVFEFQLDGLVPEADDSFAPGSVHRAEIFLPIDYPRRPPFCRMITPVFHPNIDPQKICIGDHWSAGQSLAQLIVRIGEMICSTRPPRRGRNRMRTSCLWSKPIFRGVCDVVGA